jgi:hypothetical protein
MGHFRTRHQFMVWQTHRLTILSNEEYSEPQVRMMTREIKAILGHSIPVEEWNE